MGLKKNNPGCGCCSACTICDTTPFRWQMEMTGWANGTVFDCNKLNTIRLSQTEPTFNDPVTFCRWDHAQLWNFAGGADFWAVVVRNGTNPGTLNIEYGMRIAASNGDYTWRKDNVPSCGDEVEFTSADFFGSQGNRCNANGVTVTLTPL